ncbi:hypothetical protein DF3PB_630011 [uncultured Defluviicoccus sp.]|uniref:Uncharacterized protein n=1 Tax=metagenome TaxID=256318 RepID=A0A380TIL7_9ZZZZ|nr:hypothetical protein DF3PB_630011 [uncultured Defluviicoccus sp.]
MNSGMSATAASGPCFWSAISRRLRMRRLKSSFSVSMDIVAQTAHPKRAATVGGATWVVGVQILSGQRVQVGAMCRIHRIR